MSSLIANPGPGKRHRRHSHGRVQRPAPQRPAEAVALEDGAERLVKQFEKAMHYAVAGMLSTIAVATMLYTTVVLVTAPRMFSSPSKFGLATSNAVGGVLIVLILVEITRTVVTSPDNKGIAIRRLLMIGIMSALREVLWIGVNSGAKIELGKPIAMAISTIVVVGLAMAYTLVRRVSGGRG